MSIQVFVAGARPRTLPTAVAPILAGAAAAAAHSEVNWWRTLLAFGVALFMQIGVNYANDYSDGIRGTDDERTGPTRITASGQAPAEHVKWAALASFAIGCGFGLALVWLTSQWWLIAVGALSVLAAWYYTGGKHPYGYLGLGEVSVFVFFGLVATVGTTYVSVLTFPWPSFAAGTAVGALACAVLVGNNLRDIPTDETTGKRTLAVRLGDRGARWLYVGLIGLAAAAVLAFAAGTTWWALIALCGLGVAAPQVSLVLSGADGARLIPVIQGTSVAGIGVGMGLLIGVIA